MGCSQQYAASKTQGTLKKEQTKEMHKLIFH